MGTYAQLVELPVTIDAYRLEGLELQVTPQFARRVTVVHLEGAGREGTGEDVTWDATEQRVFEAGGAVLPLAGRFTLGSFSKHLEAFDLFPRGTSQPAHRHYRRWAFESAALDLALLQAGCSLERALDRVARPVRFVRSMGLGHPPRIEKMTAWLDLYPRMRFKLDVGAGWDAGTVRALADSGAVDVVDFKGAYHGTPVDLEADPALYARVADGLPDAWLEDPALTDATRAVLAAHRPRITWDAPIHSVDDIRALDFPPRMVNMKPSRLGTLRNLFDAYDHCVAQGIGVYGGGQWELGPGRGQIQYLASLFHADAPNDVAPRAYNAFAPRPGLPASPLAARPAASGFRREGERA